MVQYQHPEITKKKIVDYSAVEISDEINREHSKCNFAKLVQRVEKNHQFSTHH